MWRIGPRLKGWLTVKGFLQLHVGRGMGIAAAQHRMSLHCCHLIGRACTAQAWPRPLLSCWRGQLWGHSALAQRGEVLIWPHPTPPPPPPHGAHRDGAAGRAPQPLPAAAAVRRSTIPRHCTKKQGETDGRVPGRGEARRCDGPTASRVPPPARARLDELAAPIDPHSPIAIGCTASGAAKGWRCHGRVA